MPRSRLGCLIGAVVATALAPHMLSAGEVAGAGSPSSAAPSMPETGDLRPGWRGIRTWAAPGLGRVGGSGLGGPRSGDATSQDASSGAAGATGTASTGAGAADRDEAASADPPLPVKPSAETLTEKQLAARARRAAALANRGTPAKKLFGAAITPAALAPRAIGFYSRGCLAGARQIAVDGAAWQAMRLSRNRRWGHPRTIALIERLSAEAKSQDGWPGLLVGDISQARGGPMLTGHASHQIGLDADIWLTPMPDRRLTPKERETLAATSMLASKVAVDPKVWTDRHAALIKRAASYREVERVLVHPAIKKALCEWAGKDPERAWLGRVRPYWGHHYHFHIRLGCPVGSPNCRRQAPPPTDDGCGKEIDDWFALLTRPPKPPQPTTRTFKPRPELTLEKLPDACRTVLEAAGPTPRGPELAQPQ